MFAAFIVFFYISLLLAEHLLLWLVERHPSDER